MMNHINVSGGYADFKTVMKALGTPKAVFWWASSPENASIIALMDDLTAVHVTVPKPAETAQSTSPLQPIGAPSPFVPVPEGHGRQTAPDTQSKAEGKGDAGHGRQTAAETQSKPRSDEQFKADAKAAATGADAPKQQQSDRPKTQLETDFPGAIELPGGGITFS